MNQKYPVNNYDFAQNVEEDEIDLREIITSLWKGKWIIILCTIIFAGSGVLFALSQPNTYQSSALLLPMQERVWTGGGIDAIGPSIKVNVPKAEALAVLQSRKFIDFFIQKYQILVPLMASSQWIEATNTLVLNDELYNAETQQWHLDDNNITLKPSALDAYKAFKDLMVVSDTKGLVSITVTHFSPVIAQQWVSLLVSELNAWMKYDELTVLNKKLDYSKSKIESTTNEEVQALLSQRLEVQYKKRILIDDQDDFVFKTIDPARVAEEKAGPRRAIICILATLIGGMFGVGLILFRFFYINSTQKLN